MRLFVITLLTMISLFFIAYPFFKQKRGSLSHGEDEKSRELHSRRDITYSMLKELEFDYQSGLLSEQDYHDLEARYKRKAISILKDADGLEKGIDVAGDIEEQVRKLRRANSSNLDEEVEEEVLKLRQSEGGFCPQCGTKSQEGDLFCSSCGAKLGKEKS